MKSHCSSNLPTILMLIDDIGNALPDTCSVAADDDDDDESCGCKGSKAAPRGGCLLLRHIANDDGWSALASGIVTSCGDSEAGCCGNGGGVAKQTNNESSCRFDGDLICKLEPFIT